MIRRQLERIADKENVKQYYQCQFICIKETKQEICQNTGIP